MADGAASSYRDIWTSWLIRTVLINVFTIGTLGGVRAVVSYRALELGSSPAQLSWLAAAYALLSMIVAIPLGRWIDRFDAPRFVVLGSVVVLATALWMMTVGSVAVLVVTQAALGFGQVTMVVALQTFLANGGDARGRVLRFGAFTLAGSLGQMVAPAITTSVYEATGSANQVFLLFAAMTCVSILLAVSLWLRPGTARRRAATSGEPPASTTRTAMTVLRQPTVPRVMFASVATIATLDLLVVYLPAYGEANAISPTVIGVLLTVRGATGVISRVGLGALLRWLGRKGVILLSLWLPAVTLALVPTTVSPALLVVLMALGGLGLGLSQPVSMAWVADLVPANVRGTALAVRMSGNRLGQLVIPLGAGVVAGATGVGAVFIAMGASMGAAALFLHRVPDTREA